MYSKNLLMAQQNSLEEIKQQVLTRDPLCLWCIYKKYYKGESGEVRQSCEAHHVIKKKWLRKEYQKLCDIKHNLVGVCKKCHYLRHVDNYEALCYFAWYLNDKCGYKFYDWYDSLPMIEKENIRRL